MKNCILFVLLFFLFTSMQWKMYASVNIHSIPITSDNGLVTNTIRYIFQDDKGFIWISTNNGLNRYDGHSFLTLLPQRETTISLADYHIKNIEEDKNGFLWIASTYSIYSCYDLKHEKFVDYTGCNEHRQAYTNRTESENGVNWLWGGENGCRKVTFKDGIFSSLSFRKETGQLPSDSINHLMQDCQGNIWICTQAGIVKVSDEKPKIISPPTAFIAAVATETNCFFLTEKGDIYRYKNEKGLEWLQRLTDKKKRFQITGNLKIKKNWYIFTPQGIYVFHLSDGKMKKTSWLNIPNAQYTKDNAGNFYIFNRDGNLHYLQMETNTLKSIRLVDTSQISANTKVQYEIVQDKKGIIWIASYGFGLFRYYPQTGQLTQYIYQEEGRNLINSNYLTTILADRTGNIWIGSEYAGITRLSVLDEGAHRIYMEKQNPDEFSNSIRALIKMPDGKFWLRTRKGKSYVYDKNLSPILSLKPPTDYLYAACADSNGDIWTGTNNQGIYVKGKWYNTIENDTLSLGHHNIFDLYCDHKKRMWIGTFGGGLNLAVPQENGYMFRRFLTQSTGLKEIRVITQDQNGIFWVGTNGGLCLFDADSILVNPFNYKLYSYENGDLPGYEVKSILKDSKGRMWIGTLGGGFSICTPNKDYRKLQFTHYSTKDGLVSNMVEGIIEDKEGKFWIATQSGLSRFDYSLNRFENFFFSTSMQGNIYNEHSISKTDDGLLLFGTHHGLLVVDPSKVRPNTFVPDVVLTDLKINGILTHAESKDSPLVNAISYTQKLELKHNQNSFAIDFSTLDYPVTNQPKFIYKLIPFDKNWSHPSTLNFASYKELSPGHYTFHVKACNSAGIWSNKETTLEITIAPPFWKSTGAYLFYFLMAGSILYISYHIVQRFNNLRNRIQIETQLTEYKLTFFTNISHEFRTPLTMIQNALEKLEGLNRIPKEMTYPIRLMSKSTNRMLQLINQLLEFRKMQNNKLSLMLEEIDIMVFFYDIYADFKELADEKNIEFHFIPSISSYKMFVDQSKLDKIVYNLLSNAFKYTPRNGKVVFTASINEKEQQLTISVSDTGIGIPKEKQGELFSRFMQSNFSHDSIGIGLHLTHELVNVLKGNIIFNENAGGGSVFTVWLPSNHDIYDKKDFLIPNSLSEEPLTRIQPERKKLIYTEPIPASALNKKKILIIEDDCDIRTFLETELSIYFEVASEPDGISGLERAQNTETDLIVCDVLMPGIDGLNVTRKLKDNFTTSHIPVILLTALSTPVNRLEGIQKGADVYITKPFSTKLLLAHIFQLLEQRDKLRKKFSNDPTMTSPVLCTTEPDKKFFDKLHSIIEQEIGNAEFSVDEFAAKAGMSRAVFFRKVKGITGHTPNEYVRIIRMKKAMELLQEEKYNISEIAYRIGMNDPLYFSKCFKAQFGVPPSAYLHKAKTETDNHQVIP